MNKQISGKKIAILATDGYEQVELIDPKKNLEQAGAKVDVISIKDGQIKGWDKTNWGKSVKVDHLVTDVKPADYDALVLPGGQINPDKLRTDKNAVEFVKQFVESGKPVAAICHGPWELIEAGVVKGKTVTSWPPSTPISPTPEPTGSTVKSSRTATSSPAANRKTSQPSATHSSRPWPKPANLTPPRQASCSLGHGACYFLAATGALGTIVVVAENLLYRK
jgi:protease I